MFGWGLAIFIGLILVFWDVNPVTKAKLAGNPMVIHMIVLGSGFWLHGGSAEGAMGAVVSGIFSALYFRFQRHFYGYILHGVWHPGAWRLSDPRSHA